MAEESLSIDDLEGSSLAEVLEGGREARSGTILFPRRPT